MGDTEVDRRSCGPAFLEDEGKRSRVLWHGRHHPRFSRSYLRHYSSEVERSDVVEAAFRTKNLNPRLLLVFSRTGIRVRPLHFSVRKTTNDVLNKPSTVCGIFKIFACFVFHLLQSSGEVSHAILLGEIGEDSVMPIMALCNVVCHIVVISPSASPTFPRNVLYSQILG